MELITTHLNADFDGVASMVAARKLYPGATLMLPGGAQDTVRSFLAVHDLGIAKLKELDPESVTRLILVGTQEPERLGPLKALCARPGVSLHVYDHHPDSGPPAAPDLSLQAELRCVEPVGATVTVLIERLRERQMALTPFEATVLAIGLYEGTGSLACASTTPRDLEAAAWLLRSGADLHTVSDVLHRNLDPAQEALLHDLSRTSEVYSVAGHQVLFAVSAYAGYGGDLADLVEQLAEMKGVEAVVVAVAREARVELIGRSRTLDIDVGRLVRAFGGKGHSLAAAASVQGLTLDQVAERVRSLLAGAYRSTLLARDVMTKPVKTIGEDTSIAEAERTMTLYGVNVLPVVNASHQYCGLITRETVQKALFYNLSAASVRDFLLTDQYHAALETPLCEIEAQMIERYQPLVPVIRGTQVVGVISRTDLLRVLHDEVVLATPVRATAKQAAVLPYRRNVKALMKERLPEAAFALLETAGQLADGSDVSVYVVGGFVRDLLLGRHNLDLDLVVEGDGIAFARALAGALHGRAKVHERFGTAMVMTAHGLKVDVATARTEYYDHPAALPTVEPSSIQKDLYRRDFTINALAISLNTPRFGELVDFYGGQRDLNEKIIRVLHSLSFVEDPTRVFRAIRFEQRFGFHLGQDALSLIKGAVKLGVFQRLSGQRLLNELIRLLSDPKLHRTMARLAELDLLRVIHPELKWSASLHGFLRAAEKAVQWHRVLYPDRKLEPWLVLFMVVMEGLSPEAVRETVKRLGMPARDVEQIMMARTAGQAVLLQLAQQPPPKPSQIYHALRGLADEVLLVLMAKSQSETVKHQVSAYLNVYQRTQPFLTGKALKAMGLTPGPQFGRILDRLLRARLDGEVRSEADERELVKRLAERPDPDCQA